MNATEIAAVAAVASVGVTVLSGLGLLIWKAGRHSQRLDAAETDIADLQAGAHEAGRLDTALQVLTGTVNSVQKQVDEIGHDVKNLLTGKVTPARRGPRG